MRTRYLLPLLLLLGCATRTDMLNMWADPDYPTGPVKTLLVVALIPDLESRQVWEEGFIESLEKNHVEATPSYMVAPYISPDSLDLMNICERAGCEGFMVILRHDPELRTIYVPGYITTDIREAPAGLPAPHPNYAAYEQTLCEPRRWIVTRRYHPGWARQELALRCDVDVWMREGERMVWTGTSEVIDPVSDQHAAYRISDRVVFELSRQGIVPAGL